MKRRSCQFISCVGLLFLILSVLTSCESDAPDPQPVLPKRTVLAYFVSDNNLSGLTKADFQEMCQTPSLASLLSTCRFLVYIDDLSTPVLYELEVNDKGSGLLTPVRSYETELTSTQAETLSGVIDYVCKEYAAQNYGFIYWSHGDGWAPAALLKSADPLQWIGADMDNGTLKEYDKQDISSLVTSLEHFGKKLDFVFFDACFMLSVETAWTMRQVTDLVIGSPTETPGAGAPYNLVLPSMLTAGNFDLDQFVKAYYQDYISRYSPTGEGLTNSNWTGGAAIGGIRTSELQALADFSHEMAQSGLLNPDADFSKVQELDRRSRSSYIGYKDLYGMYHKMLEGNQSALERFDLLFKAAQPSYLTTSRVYSGSVGMFSMSGSNGLSCYKLRTDAGGAALNEAYRKEGWYQAAGLGYLDN